MSHALRGFDPRTRRPCIVRYRFGTSPPSPSTLRSRDWPQCHPDRHLSSSALGRGVQFLAVVYADLSRPSVVPAQFLAPRNPRARWRGRARTRNALLGFLLVPNTIQSDRLALRCSIYRQRLPPDEVRDGTIRVEQPPLVLAGHSGPGFCSAFGSPQVSCSALRDEPEQSDRSWNSSAKIITPVRVR